MKITVVGGGSTYTPEVVDGLARLRHLLPVTELCLTDPQEERLALVSAVSDRMLRRHGYPVTVTHTPSLVEAVADADVVLLQLRVGGQAARNVDETLPLECGCVGQETTGVGGLAKALRTVPVVLDIAEHVRRHAAPHAWIIDFTNPVGIVTRALLDAGHRAVGLCNVAIGNQRAVASHFGVQPQDVSLDHVGLNHLTWTRGITVDGRDVLPELLREAPDLLAGRSGLTDDVLRRLQVWPSYYLKYYYEHDAVVKEQQQAPSRAAEVAAIESELLEMYRDTTVDTKPALLERRGGAFYSDAAVELVASLVSDKGDVQVVNLRNEGTLPFLPSQAVIEVPARITGDGPIAESIAPVDPLFSGLIAHVSHYEELALDAAIHGGRERVFRALLAHPLIGQVSTADSLTDRLIAANRHHLSWAE